MSREKIQKLEVDERRADDVNSDDQPEIFKINDICLIHIFSFLPIPERIRIQRVCKRWQAASTLSWCDMKKLDIGSKHYGFLNKSLKCDKLSLSIMKQVLRLCGPCLTHIDINDIDGWSSNHTTATNKKLLALVKEMCPNLKSIDFSLSLCRRTMRFIADNFDNLRQCTIAYASNNFEDILSIFLLKNKNLESFRLFSLGAKGDCMRNLSAESIKHIEIYHCQRFLPENLSYVLQNIDALETLGIDYCKKILANMNEILKLAPERLNLKTLKLQSGYYSGRKIIHISYMHKFTNLQTLKLVGEDILHDEILVDVGKYCKNLQRAIFGQSNRVRDSGLKHVTHLPKLDYLELEDLSKITNKIVPHLLELRSVKCIRCYRLEDRAFRDLMEMSKNLEYLEVDRSSLDWMRYEINEIRISTKPLKLCIKGKNSTVTFTM